MSTPHRENGMETTGMKRCLYENDAREGCLVGMLWRRGNVDETERHAV